MATHSLCQSPSLMSSLGLLCPAASSSSSSGSCCCALSRRAYCASPLHISTSWHQRGGRRHLSSLHVVAEAAEAAAAPPATSDGLTMNLKVEGTLADSLISKVTDALKNIQGVSNLKVYTSEGVATVENGPHLHSCDILHFVQSSTRFDIRAFLKACGRAATPGSLPADEFEVGKANNHPSNR